MADLHHDLRAVRRVPVYEYVLQTVDEDGFDIFVAFGLTEDGMGAVLRVEVGESESGREVKLKSVGVISHP